MLNHGGGTIAHIRASSSYGSNMTNLVPSRQTFFNSYRNSPPTSVAIGGLAKYRQTRSHSLAISSVDRCSRVNVEPHHHRDPFVRA
jgi:hypothetical protein